jgi:hypothetical protein
LVIDSFLAEERFAIPPAEPSAQADTEAVDEQTQGASSIEYVESAAEFEAEEPAAAEPDSALIPEPVRELALAPPAEQADRESATDYLPVSTAELEVTAEGLVVPAGISGGWVSPPALMLRVATTAPASATEEVFWDATSLSDGFVSLCLGVATAPHGGASEVAETARHLLRASALQGEGPARGLGLLAGWLASTGSVTAWISAIEVQVDVKQSTASWCAAGAAALASRYSDGRGGLTAAQHAPLGSLASFDAVERDVLLLKGDRIALTCGDVDALASASAQSQMMASLTITAKADALLRALETSGSAAGAFVFEACS